MKEWNRLALHTLMGLGLCGGAAEAGILFDPTGTGGPTVDIGGLDWTQTSFVAQGGNAAVANRLAGNCANGGCDFNVYSSAVLSTALNQAGNPTNLPGLNTNYEITLTIGFTETVTSAIQQPSGTAFFQVVPSAVSFVQIFQNTTLNSDPINGSGFNDGTLILSGNGLQGTSAGVFTVSSQNPVALDQKPPTDNYPGQRTLPGSGGNEPITLGIGNLTTDPRYFTNIPTNDPNFSMTVQLANISQSLPFNNIDPMDCFITTPTGAAVGSTVGLTGCQPGAHVLGPFSAQPTPPAPGYLPVIGAINGFLGTSGGPDVVAQTDYNSRFNVSTVVNPEVPEPASLAIMGLGLGVLGAVRRKGR